MRVYHFVNRKYGLQNLRRKRLKIATINELNDPFELLGVASNDKRIRDQYAQLKAGLARYCGLLCFSGNWRSPAQWSHYADKHQGICLGFEISERADLVPVTYRQRRLLPNTAAMRTEGPAAQRHVRQILSTKFSHWRYEDEHRLFVARKDIDRRGLSFFDFCDDVALKEVIVGHNCTITPNELKRALGAMATEVDAWQARLAFRSFRVVKQKSKEIWHWNP